MLLAQWAAGHVDLHVVWIQVEPIDDDPVHFSRRLLRGLGAIVPEFAVNTIKTHMAHIFQKLGAVNRNDAIARARAIGLL